jgi:hypothetical protein
MLWFRCSDAIYNGLSVFRIQVRVARGHRQRLVSRCVKVFKLADLASRRFQRISIGLSILLLVIVTRFIATRFIATSPVTKFPPNGYGHDMAGNVWQWTSYWYRPDYYRQLAASGSVIRNPKGLDNSFDPDEPGVSKRVMRGGSFLCTDQYCSRDMVGTRGKGDVSTGTNHLGFRCVKRIPPA